MPGDLVLKNLLPTRKNPAHGKLGFNWEGPYIISRVVRPGNYELQKEEGKILQHVWNAEHLKRFYQQTLVCNLKWRFINFQLTIRPFTGYFVRRHKQLRHIMLKKITCNRTRKLIAIKENVSLYSKQITFSYNQWLHLGSTQYKQFPQKNKMEGVCAEEKEKGRMRRGRKEERKTERMKGKRRKGKR